jgi:hypothetical protein
MRRITSDRARIHLFFDFWLMGTRHLRIRARMRAELARYRQAFRPVVDEVLRSEPNRFANVTALEGEIIFMMGALRPPSIDPAREEE